MRAKTVFQKAYVFDLDDTLIKSNAKVKVLSNGKLVRTLTPAEFNTYKKNPGEEFGFEDFGEKSHLFNAVKYKMWTALTNIDRAVKEGRSNSEIFILTARPPEMQKVILKFLRREGVTSVPLDNIITIGDTIKGNVTIADKKKEILTQMVEDYDEVRFFDDDEKNIELAKQVPGVKTRLIESDI